MVWNFSQPISDNMEEAVSGVKGELAVKIYGDDLKMLEAKGEEIVDVMRHVNGIEDLGLFRVIGQPNLNFVVDREAAARYRHQRRRRAGRHPDRRGRQRRQPGAAGRGALRPGGALSAALPRHAGGHRQHPPPRALRRDACRWRSSARWQTRDGASQIYREGEQRYVAIKYSVRGRDLGGTVEEAIGEGRTSRSSCRPGYHIGVGRASTKARSAPRRRLLIIVPLTVFLIFMILYTMFGSAKWAWLILVNVAMARIGGLLALLVTGTHFSVSSGVGFLALFGVSVQTGVIMVEYINQLRARGYPIVDAAIEGATRRLRPIMMTMLVATLGLLPAAISHDIGSDSQRPFAIVIVGGLIADLIMSVFLLPTFYVWWARPTDHLPKFEESKSIDAGDEISEGTS